jgi:hypothetical protein
MIMIIISCTRHSGVCDARALSQWHTRQSTALHVTAGADPLNLQRYARTESNVGGRERWQTDHNYRLPRDRVQPQRRPDVPA